MNDLLEVNRLPRQRRDAVARALAAKNEAESRELKAAQELDEAITMLHNFADLCAEFCDHTPDSFNRQVMRLGNAARLLLNARKPWSSDLGPNVGIEPPYSVGSNDGLGPL